MCKMETDSYDYPVSVALAQRTHAEPYRCWRNAVIALLASGKLFARASYIEGWIVLPRPAIIEIVEHGWIVADQRIIDPSLALIEPLEQPVFYFAGLQLSYDELPDRLQGKILPLVCHSSYGADGMGFPGYQDASIQARRRARALADESHLPETAIVVSTRTSTGAVTVITHS
jgi:hypothetical protein